MPKSKRERKSAITQVKKKTREVKNALVTRIRDAAQQYSRVFVFDVENMKNSTMKEVREQWEGSKFFLGKNKVMQLALGKIPEEEQKSGFAKLSQTVSGSRGLLFTDRSTEEVLKEFHSFSARSFARSGFECTKSYKLAAGTLPVDRCPHPMEPMLRKLGLPTKLQQGKVELLNDVNVCAKGDVLTPEQCKILQIFGVKMAQFKLKLLYAWEDGKVQQVFDESDTSGEGEDAGSDEPLELRDAGDEGEVFQGGFVEDEELAGQGEDEDEEM